MIRLISLHYLTNSVPEYLQIKCVLLQPIGFLSTEGMGAITYINSILAMKMMHMQSVHMLIHPSPFPQVLNAFQSYLMED